MGGTHSARRLARKVLTWLMDTGLLLEYSLARKLELEGDGEPVGGLEPQEEGSAL
jgi:hypothetical protein